MDNTNNFIVPEAIGLNEQELLEFYDNPRNFNVKDCREEEWIHQSEEFPEHCLTFLTHGTYAVNEKIRRTTNLTKAQFNRLIKNYSDFGTDKMFKKSGIPQTNVIKSPGSRAISDYNRKNRTIEEDAVLPEGQKSIRSFDFNEVEIINNPSQFRNDGQYKTNMYHESLSYALDSVEDISGGSIGFDIHDTGVNLMGIVPENDIFRSEGFPFAILGTKDGESCNPEILEYFAERLHHYLGIKAKINTKYKGGYVTTRHGLENRASKDSDKNPANKSVRNMIQLELGRFLYMKESTQEVDWERMEIIGEGLKRAIADTGIKFGEEYFQEINN